MDAKNLIPFRSRWTIVTENNKIVSGIMLEDHEIHPSEDRSRFTAKANIDAGEVANEYVELRLRYESLYSAEFGNPPQLSGEVVRRYRFKDGKVYPW